MRCNGLPEAIEYVLGTGEEAYFEVEAVPYRQHGDQGTGQWNRGYENIVSALQDALRECQIEVLATRQVLMSIGIVSGCTVGGIRFYEGVTDDIDVLRVKVRRVPA